MTFRSTRVIEALYYNSVLKISSIGVYMGAFVLPVTGVFPLIMFVSLRVKKTNAMAVTVGSHPRY